MRVLDEVAEAIDEALGYRLRFTSEVRLEELFGGPLSPEQWDVIRRRLMCRLQPLEFVQGHWFLPDGFTDVWDLVDAVADAYPDWEVPEVYTTAAWRNAQIFVVVKYTLVDALCVRPSLVTREARLMRDLGAS